jgi:hypothetical protein
MAEEQLGREGRHIAEEVVHAGSGAAPGDVVELALEDCL